MSYKIPEVMDTTNRDGEQMDGVSFSPEEKLLIARNLLNIGVSRVEVASAHAVGEDRRALEEICKMADVLGKPRSVEVLGFVNTKSVDWIYDAGGRVINLLTKGSREHREVQLKKTLVQHLGDVSKVIDYAKSKGMDINVYLEDSTTGMMEDLDDVLRMIGALEKMQVKRIMLPDTRGRLPFWSTEEYLRKIIKEFSNTHIDYHAHNDYEMAVANTLAAIRAGVSGVHLTLNGLGERTGNANLYSVVAGAKDHLGIDLGIDEESFMELSRLVELASRVRVGPNAPIVGRNAHYQSAGIHADGDKKGELYKAKLRSKRFGAETTQYTLGKVSGNASIEMNLRNLGITAEPEVVKRLTERVRELGGQKTTVTPDDLFLLFLDETGASKEKPFEIIECSADVGLQGTRKGYVKMKVNGTLYEETGIGDGGYDAIANAIRKITDSAKFLLPKLVDYDVRIPPGGGTGALVETVITWENGEGKTFRTTGVDTDQTIAAVKATERMLNLVGLGYK